MSTARGIAFLLLVACGHEPPPATAPPVALPEPTPVPRASAPPAVLAPPPLPTVLAAPADGGTPHGVDAGAFKRPTGVYALTHETSGETDARLLTKAASCAKADAYVRVEIATARIVHAEGPPSVTDCIGAFLKRDASWKHGYDVAELEIVVTK